MYEIEIKSLLGDSDGAEKLRKKMTEMNPSGGLLSKNKQLNHYFIGGDIDKLYETVAPLFDNNKRDELERTIKNGKDFSVRTRQLDSAVFLVIKASIDDTTSANGISRVEFEEEVIKELNELDEIIINSGFEYQAKWSREREEYKYKGANVTIDKNAGYGYLAEFEKVIDDESLAAEVANSLRGLMTELEVEELPQDRLERMFAYYNEHWPEYYGTDKIFLVE